MREVILEAVNYFLSAVYGKIVLIGLLFALLLEAKGIFSAYFVPSKKKKAAILPLLKPLGKRVLYVLSGVVMVYFSYTLASLLLLIFPTPAMELKELWPGFISLTNSTFVLMVAGFIVAGVSLTLSAGTRWLIQTCKLIATLTVIFSLLMITLAGSSF